MDCNVLKLPKSQLSESPLRGPDCGRDEATTVAMNIPRTALLELPKLHLSDIFHCGLKQMHCDRSGSIAAAVDLLL